MDSYGRKPLLCNNFSDSVGRLWPACAFLGVKGSQVQILSARLM